MKKTKNVTAVLFLIILFTQCTSMVQKAGELLEGGAFDESTISLYRNRGKPRNELQIVLLENSTREIVISSNAYPNITIHGSIRPGGSNFTVTHLEFISSHIHGWSEFTLDLTGEGYFPWNSDNGTLIFHSQIDTGEISSGRIRYKETRIAGNEALASLRNRRERILALVEWMDTRRSKHNFASEKQFEKYWKSIIFPELVSRSKRPPEYTEDGAEWVRANDIRWNVNYTRQFFPEELWGLRNSGALLRDWEESISWIYFEYVKDYIFSYFNGLEFTRKK
ncbi:MAG: hypothetical protein LBI14_01385 [Treponema sp.]|nr:hypothetical protein [Treponema sp.]